MTVRKVSYIVSLELTDDLKEVIKCWARPEYRSKEEARYIKHALQGSIYHDFGRECIITVEKQGQ